jgi:hypothetical protein
MIWAEMSDAWVILVQQMVVIISKAKEIPEMTIYDPGLQCSYDISHSSHGPERDDWFYAKK